MESQDTEKLFDTAASHLTSHFEEIPLLAQSETKPLVLVPKHEAPIYDSSINLSVTSDASEFDNAVFPNAQHPITSSHLSPFDSIGLSPFSHMEPTASVRPKVKNHVEDVREPGLSKFQQCTVTGFNSNINSKSLPTSRQNFDSLHQFTNNSSKSRILDKNGEFRPGFSMQHAINTSFSPGHQDVSSAISNSENVKGPCEAHNVANTLNKSDSVIVLSKQFQESNDMNGYFNGGKYVVEDVSNPIKFRKQRSLGGRHEGSVCSKFQQESLCIDSGISSADSLNSITKESVPNEIWALFHQQNEKIKELQTQLSAIQQQNNSKSDSKQQSEIQLSEDINMINGSLNNIMQYLVDNKNAILTLKDEVSILGKRLADLELKSRNDIAEPLGVSSSGASPNAKVDAASTKSKSKDGVMCHNETHVKKTSSSTMTSITYDGNDKLLFHKTTVVTEDCQQGLLLQCSQNKAPSVNSTQGNNSKNHLSEVVTNYCSKCSTTTPKSLHPKKLKSKELVKSDQGCENVTPSSNRHSPASSTLKIRTSNGKNSSPLSDSNSENRKREIRQSPNQRNVPNYDRIVRNIHNLVLREDEVDEPLEKHCNSHCCSKTAKNCSSTGTSAAKRKSRSQRHSEMSASASTSEDSDYVCPKSGCTDIDPSRTNYWYNSTETKFGISSALMSVDTQQYLEKHCDDLEKWSSKKSKAPHSKRQLR